MTKKNLIKIEKAVVGLFPIVDIILSPVVVLSAIVLKLARRIRISRLPFCKKILFKIGVFPVRDHYYEPLFNPKYIKKPLDEKRDLPGIDWNIEEQINLLYRFQFNDELRDIALSHVDDLTFNFNNNAFESGDAEYWYNIIRLKKPKTIIEIGSGNSTLMAIKAIKKNKEEDPAYLCKHICVEPYEMAWLERSGVSVMRKKVENIDKKLFEQLEKNDILFIDSSHIIRPQGDVLFEYLELLPILKSGVIVHIHDIFSPRDYPKEWITNEIKFWNEQYLLEAFLTSNRDWKIIGALNYLKNDYYEKIKEKCPYLTSGREPGSFYLQKIK
ncbi:MAG: class I SAM-dependent methyltransferase [Candidatus Pacebacteria bacterium]|nr:class I SAM-dependent methyltransferase [Candidatus Paceibacterota bacterium]